MSEFKGTKGAWEVRVEQIAPGSNATCFTVAADDFDVVSPLLGVRCEDDALLIAAAPELLEALRSIVSDHEFCGDEWGDRREEWIKTARAAIAKALNADTTDR